MITIFYYHRVGPFRPGAPRRMTVPPEAFKSQMYFLRRNNIRVLDVDAVAPLLANPSSARPKGVVLTFDDGHLDTFTHAVPVLKSLRFPAAFFIVAGFVGGEDDWNRDTGMPRERLLGWEEILSMRSDGLTIGSHSMTHRVMTELSESEAQAEAVRSKRLLEEKLGQPVSCFAYPKGRASSASERIVESSGYALAFGTRSGVPLSWNGRFNIQRIPVSANDSLAEFAAKIVKSRIGRYRR